jgi:ribose/xylose/arabinose/galactoside ABC-type transport system permease subunit
VTERFGLVFLLVAEIVLFSVLPKTSSIFLTLQNFRTVAANQSVLSIAALASILPLIGGNFDLSVRAVALLSDIACAAATANFHAPLAAAIVVAIAIGAAIGLGSPFSSSQMSGPVTLNVTRIGSSHSYATSVCASPGAS